MKKRVYLAIFALTFGLCAGCGNKEADSDISGMEDTVFQTEEPLELSGTGNIDLSEENKDSGGENADSSEENNGFNGIPFVPQKLRNFPAILEHRKIQTNPL